MTSHALPLGHLHCQSLSEFTNLTKVGEGTYGTVFKAKSSKRELPVALKKINFFRGGRLLSTTTREISILQGLNHANVVKLYSVVAGPTQVSMFLEFEYCELDLCKVVNRVAYPFSMSERKGVVVQVLNAVDYLHRHHIIHRDLKLENLLYNGLGQVKLADFGLARRFRRYFEARYTRTVTSLWYRAPEVMLGCEYDQLIDVWAVGCIFAELNDREPLFSARTERGQVVSIVQTLGSIVEEDFPGLYDAMQKDLQRKLRNCKERDAGKNQVAGGRTKLEDKIAATKQGAILPTDLVDERAYMSLNEERAHPQLTPFVRRMLCLAPKRRATAREMLQHPFLVEEGPMPSTMLPTFPEVPLGR